MVCIWSSCLEKLRLGEVDLLATIAYTSERLRVYDFNQTTVIANWGVLYGQPDNKLV